jgi:thiol:disulfide interchange protein DsbC
MKPNARLLSPLARLAGLALAVVLSLALAFPALAQEAAIRKNLAERLPQLPKIDEVSRTPVAGLFEVRFGGTQILYSDASGDFIFANGSLIDTKTRSDLTEERIDKLSAIDFKELPLKDAMVARQGSGARKMAVFVDPNCGFCKRFERDLSTVKDVTVYTFLMPILGPDSSTKSRDIWCAKDPQKAWRAWMLDGVVPPKAAANCNSDALDRNLALSKKHRINGTPALFFEDGSRKPGALPADQVERLLAAAAKKG